MPTSAERGGLLFQAMVRAALLPTAWILAVDDMDRNDQIQELETDGHGSTGSSRGVSMRGLNRIL